MKKRIEVVMVIVLIAAAAVIAPGSARYVMNQRVKENAFCICVDAGHGGDDPGKVGVGGTKEKDMNLQIALKLQKELEKEGFRVVMTRETDVDLAEAGAASQKVSDMRERCALIDEANPDMTISIHQNSYTDSAVQGAQTFYYGASAEGKALAEVLQAKLVEYLDPSNHRQAKANESYYLLKKTSVPTVIVECGFLSNQEEEKKLQEDAYQDLVVTAICAGVQEYLK